MTNKNAVKRTILSTEEEATGRGTLTHFISTTRTGSHQPYEANIATMFYKYKNSSVTPMKWKQKSKTSPWRRAGQISNGDVPMIRPLPLPHGGITSEPRKTMHLS